MRKQPKLALTREAAWKAKQMYAELDTKGRRKHTIMEIADFLGVGETTVWRVINSAAAYQSIPDVKTEDELTADIEASKKRFAELLAKERMPIPASLLDGGIPAAEDKPPVMLEKLAKDIYERSPDSLIDELKGESDGRSEG